jgi:hypothetical protein
MRFYTNQHKYYLSPRINRLAYPFYEMTYTGWDH